MTFLILLINKNRVCPECFNNTFKQDLFHNETYCTVCGLVVRDNELMTQAHYDFLTERINIVRDVLPTAIIE